VIMFTDMVGYTKLTRKNEALAVDLLEEHRKILRPLFPRHNGREVKTMGDGFLVEFASALEAVKCAFGIQKSLHDRNMAAPIQRRILIRIGIHLGDVVHSKSDVYGDAVNVASRIEPLADPGGISVSGQVYESVKNVLNYSFENLRIRELTDVADTIMVYKILLPWREKYSPIPLRGKDLPAD
jgi:adenylate cyclase